MRTLRVAPNETTALLNYADLLNARGDHEKAHLLMQRALASHPPSPTRAVFQSDSGRDGGPGAVVGDMIDDVAPAHVRIYQVLAETMRYGGAEDDAEQVYREILALCPGNEVAVSGLASMLASRGLVDGGKDCFLEALSSDPTAGRDDWGASTRGGNHSRPPQTEGLRGGKEASLRALFGEYLWRWCGDAAGARRQLEAALLCEPMLARAREIYVSLMLDLAPPSDVSSPGEEADTTGDVAVAVGGLEELAAVDRVYGAALASLAAEGGGALETARLRAEWAAAVLGANSGGTRALARCVDAANAAHPRVTMHMNRGVQACVCVCVQAVQACVCTRVCVYP